MIIRSEDQKSKISLDDVIRIGHEITNWRKVKQEGGSGADFFKEDYNGNKGVISLYVEFYSNFSVSGDSTSITVTAYSRRQDAAIDLGSHEYRMVPSGFLGLGLKAIGDDRIVDLYKYAKLQSNQNNLFQ